VEEKEFRRFFLLSAGTVADHLCHGADSNSRTDGGKRVEHVGSIYKADVSFEMEK